MTATRTSATEGFLDAILARDLPRACDQLHAEIDFRAMTPKRFWEGTDPASVEETLRAWFENPDRDVERVEAIDPYAVADTQRIGWRVHGQSADGPFVYEQQAYIREQDERIVWMRVICSGPRPAGARA